MRKVSIVWLTEARIEKNEIIDYIAERNVLAALGVDQHIEQQVGQLAGRIRRPETCPSAGSTTGKPKASEK